MPLPIYIFYFIVKYIYRERHVVDINTTITGVLKKLAGMIFVENTNKLADSQTEKGG